MHNNITPSSRPPSQLTARNLNPIRGQGSLYIERENEIKSDNADGNPEVLVIMIYDSNETLIFQIP